jgi:predicted RNA-binding Zn ribbon-like protein
MAIALSELRRNGGHPVLDFANTVDPRGGPDQIDYIRSYGDLLRWGRLEGVIDARSERELIEKADRNPRRAAAEFRRAIALRELIARIFFSVADDARPRPRDVEELSSIAASARAAQVLTAESRSFAWSWKEPADLDLPVLALADGAASLLVESGALGQRIRLCAGHPCGWLFLDTSKGGKRRWCSMEFCGNRAKARRMTRRS